MVGTGASASVFPFMSVALSGDGNTAIVGIPFESFRGTAWVYTHSGAGWTQQGGALAPNQEYIPEFGWSAALSSDGNTALIGGPFDEGGVGAAWVFTRSNGVWSQQSKLVGSGVSGPGSEQGSSVALSADGNTAVVGGPFDDYLFGAAWIFTRSGVTWAQQGGKLVGTGASVMYVGQGSSAALSADGNTALQGNKLVGTGAEANSQGVSVALSGDGATALLC